MAIWPFGRKNKRHTVQLDTAATADIHMPQEPRLSLDDAKLGRKPSRKKSKRQKNRHLQPADDLSGPVQDAQPLSSQPTAYPPPTSHSEHPVKGARGSSARTGLTPDGYMSRTTVAQDQPSFSRNASLRRQNRSENGPAVLKKKLSKRKAYEIAREREIRLMSSSPIDIPRRSATLPGEQGSVYTRRGPRAQSRRSDRYFSDVSLPLHDSASSLSDYSESCTFKVNGFAAWTPRPVIRYVEAPRVPTARSLKPSEASTRREVATAISVSEDNLHSRKRVDKLADDLDAGALRELLERDRRRRERKKAEEYEKLQRKLQRAAERQRLEEEVTSGSHNHQAESQDMAQAQRGRPSADYPAESRECNTEDASGLNETRYDASGVATGSWLRGLSKDTERSDCRSLESVHVIGNIDDSSIRERKLGMRRSFAPSQEMGMSLSTLSPSHSPTRREVYSPTSSQAYNIGRESTSDVSRTLDPDRRLSDHSSGRVNTITSLFRRGSSRLKRRYRERFQDRGSEFSSNTSHESFFKVPTQSSGPPPYVPPKTFLHSGTMKRSQSKFREHFGDEPLSPPDSRLQSPDIPEEPFEQSEMETEKSELHEKTQYPIPGSDSEPQDARANHHYSWTGDSMEGDVDNIPLSQSLASIDSEGSWMSGQFLRRISQRTSTPGRPSLSSSRNRLDEERAEPSKEEEILANEQLVKFSTNHDETTRASHVLSEQDNDFEMVNAPEPTEETWHDEIAKRPVLVNPAVRPKSNEGLLNNVQSMCAISMEEEFSPIEEHPAEFYFETNDDYNGHHGQ
ncbi:hypothetical protein ANOM_002874 [Aspergillus nomiae NRRL 13137]|uniref:Uncharacterized protein n=1 Tax=Aspergillus nomiae NRRL (strain ATCC 15546 / NRRL 13137 / CBS 260.88 / M93) TaxID=1509407 RepID=A0A0L1JDK7_ASPN3|nr:uncharacterized protein ANOM_002874 [Aspergillus nomiae NRRL 13137]KNG89816.1 hypothetical protein ANOM_002874 [Aspergillus nomiae NRRL 13137]